MVFQNPPIIYTHPVLLSMYSSTHIYLFIWQPEHCSQHSSIGLDNQGSRFNAWQGQELFSKAPRLAPGSGPVQPPTQWVIRALSSGEKMSEHEADHSPPPLPTHVMPFWHVDTASLHIHIILSFQNLSLEIGLQPTHKFLQNATNTLHIPLLCAHDYQHKHIVHGPTVHRAMQ